MKKITKFLTYIIICQGAGLVGSVFTFSAIDSWYRFLNRPSYNPPNWIFGPVWTTLYFLMAISWFLVAQKKGAQTRWFKIQLALNALWSVIFFGLKNPELALVEIVFLWLSIVLTIKSFYSVRRLAAYLLLPYLFWVTFAAWLNLMIAWLN